MRDDKVTISKGIGILLMVAAHAGIPDMISRFIVMFHMPLFFFMSGYCFKKKYLLLHPMTFINKRIIGLYIPWVKWSLLFLLFHNVLYYLNIYNAEYGNVGMYTLKEYVLRCIWIVIGLWGQDQLLGGYWFLPQLLYASIIGFFTIKYVRNLYAGTVLVLIVTVIFLCYNLKVPFWAIKSLTFFSAFFFLMGYLYRKTFDNLNKAYLSVLFAIIVVIGSAYWPTSMLRYTVNNMLPYAVCAVCGTILILNISQYILLKRKSLGKLLIYIGNNTLTILTWHFLCFKLVSFIIIKWYDLPIEQLAYFPIIHGYESWWPVYFFVGAGMPLGVLYLWRNYAFSYLFRRGKRSVHL